MRRMFTPALAVGFALWFGAAATPALAQSQVFNGSQVVTPFGNSHGHRGHHGTARPYVAPRAYVANPGINKYHGRHHRHGNGYATHHRGHSGRRW